MVSAAPDEVREALERVLSSDTFANAGRLSRLLRYVVERTLAGEGSTVKEYVLGVDVFDRPDTYDPRIDSIVRVEARRLRTRLADYYRGAGQHDPVRIDVPLGTYVPVFSTSPAPNRSTSQDPHIATSDRHIATSPNEDIATSRDGEIARSHVSRRSLAVVAMVLVTVAALAIAVAAWRLQAGPPAVTSNETQPIRVAVLPFASFSASPDDALLAGRVTDAVTTDLARAGELSVVSRTSAAQFVSEARPVSEVAAVLDVDLIIEGSVIAEGPTVRVTARLVDPSIDRKVWVGEYEGARDRLADVERRLAREATGAIVQVWAARRQ